MLRVILATVSTVAVLVLLLSFKTHSTSAITTPPAAVSNSGGTTGGPASGTTSGPAGGTTSGPASTPSSSSGNSTPATKTVTGTAAGTIYGPVQVRITVTNGKVTAVDAVEYPENSPRDAQINSYAIPALNQEALSAGSAHIDTVSGASYTSGGYVTSLQSALDKAGL
jgi:uncharacterized protein with FMN-binding domain